MNKDKTDITDITFSFGENWKDYSSTITDEVVQLAKTDLDDSLGLNFIESKTVIDIGSSLLSLSFH